MCMANANVQTTNELLERITVKIINYFFYAHSQSQKGCNTFFRWVSEYILFTERLVFIYGLNHLRSTSLRARLSSETHRRKKYCNLSMPNCTFE